MKGAVFILISCAIALAYGKEIGRSVCSPNSFNLLPHENCDQFYFCLNGQLLEQYCTPGFLFNAESQVCDFPRNVQCNGQKAKDTNINACGPENSLIPHEQNCNQFYLCNDGISILRACAPGLAFNAEKQVCDLANNVQCMGRKMAHVASIETCSSENSLIPHEENCNEFYLCKNGVAIPLTCTHGFLFNAEKQMCDWAYNVQCVGKKSAEITSTKSCSFNNILMPHENCDQFYVCLNGQTMEQHCTPGLLFNAELQVCDFPQNVQCNGQKVKTTNINACGPENSLIPHEQNCNQFYLCNDGISILRACAPGLAFNAEKQVCDWADNVQCMGRKMAHVASIKTCSSENSLIPHEDNCNEFYLCKNGIAMPLTCSHGLLFNAEKQVCDWAHNVQCVGMKSAEITSVKSCSSYNILMPHENCNQFYICEGGYTVAKTCAPGLYFNSEKQVCDWAQSVQCSERKLPQVTSFKTCTLENNLIPHEEKCNEFYLCDKGIAIQQVCSNGLLFNVEKQICDWPENVQC